MAPYVRYEWGDRAYECMKEVKRIFDPNGLLNPGVIFNDDPQCHLKHFKPLPILFNEERRMKNEERGMKNEAARTEDSSFSAEGTILHSSLKRVDKCIECGFCEVNCVSCGFTLSSR